VGRGTGGGDPGGIACRYRLLNVAMGGNMGFPGGIMSAPLGFKLQITRTGGGGGGGGSYKSVEGISLTD